MQSRGRYKLGVVGVLSERAKCNVRVVAGFHARIKLHQNPRAIRESPLRIVGNGLDRSANLPTCWGGGTRKARDGGAKLQQNSRAAEVVRPYSWIDKLHFILCSCV